MVNLSSRIAALLVGLLLALGGGPSLAQSHYSTEEIEQMVAPIALYPDPLLSQVLMAATYPLDVVKAARWRAGQPRTLSDQQLSVLLQNQPWDPSVKSLAAFPDVLSMMDQKIDWTSELGDAFLDQQSDVMAAVQRLRARAQAAGNLRSGPQQVVEVSGSPSVIVIQPAQPDVIYVPIYNPLLVYGVWPYPAYRPYYWYPPYYVATGTVFGFSAGLIVGQALWSHYDWHHGYVAINPNRYNSFNRTHITISRWQHDMDHRQGAARYEAGRRDQFNNPRGAGLQGRPGTNGSAQYARPSAPGNQNAVRHSGRGQDGPGMPNEFNRPQGRQPGASHNTERTQSRPSGISNHPEHAQGQQRGASGDHERSERSERPERGNEQHR